MQILPLHKYLNEGKGADVCLKYVFSSRTREGFCGDVKPWVVMGAFPKCFCSAIVPSVWCCSLKCPSIVFFSRGYCQSHTQTTHMGAVTYSELRWAALAWSEHFQKKCSWRLNWSIFLLIRIPILIYCSFVISVAVWECDAAIKTPMLFSYSFFFKFRIQNTFFCEHTSELKQFWSPSQKKNNRKMKDEESGR